MTHLCTVRLAAEAHRPTELPVHICMGLAAQVEWHVLFKSDVEVRVVVGGVAGNTCSYPSPPSTAEPPRPPRLHACYWRCRAA
jgi:hypothetical protein